MRSRVLETASHEVGRGILAGLAGTLLLTLGMAIEAKLRREPSSRAAGDAAGKVLGVAPAGERGRVALSTLVHWAYGAGWGMVRSGLGAVGLRGIAAPLALLGGILSAQAIILPATKVAPSLHRWPRQRLLTDLLQHTLYVGGVELAYRGAGRGAHRSLKALCAGG